MIKSKENYLNEVRLRGNPEHIWLDDWMRTNTFYSWSEITRQINSALTHHDVQWRAMRAREVAAAIFKFEIPLLTVTASTLRKLEKLVTSLDHPDVKKHVDTTQYYFEFLRTSLSIEQEERASIAPDTIPWWSDTLMMYPSNRKGGLNV